jgi:hypothetical protein
MMHFDKIEGRPQGPYHAHAISGTWGTLTTTPHTSFQAAVTSAAHWLQQGDTIALVTKSPEPPAWMIHAQRSEIERILKEQR